MLKRLLIVALVGGIAASVPTALAAPAKDKPEQAENAKKKPKKAKKEKADKGDKEKPERAKPTDMTLTGALELGEEKGGKPTFVLATADGDVTIRGKKAEGLKDWVDKRVTIACKGRLVENKKGKTLAIAKLGEVTEAAK